jgi:hypothetical protein
MILEWTLDCQPSCDQLIYEDLVSLCGVCLEQARQNFFTSTLYSFARPREYV